MQYSFSEMDIKKEIELLLESLRELGKERREIEKDLKYSRNYIDQNLSKGGTKKFLSVLQQYAERLQNAKQPPISNSMVNEDLIIYERDYDKLINQILSDRKIIIDLHEARSKQAEELARKMEGHYEDAKELNSRLLDIIDNSLKDITKNLKETAAKLKPK